VRARQTEGHSFGNHLISESVSVTPPSVTETSLYSALFCAFMARVGCNLEQRVFIYDCYEKKKTHTNRAGEHFTVNFPTQHIHLEIQFSKLVKKVQTHVILIDRKPLRRNHVSTEEKLDDIVIG
jgi:hypothetical protein